MTGVPPLTPTTAAHYGPVDRRQSATRAAHSQQIKAKLVVASIEAPYALIFEPIGCCQTCCVSTGLERQLKEGLPASLSTAHDGTTRLFIENDNEEAVASAAANPLVTVGAAPTADQ